MLGQDGQPGPEHAMMAGAKTAMRCRAVLLRAVFGLPALRGGGGAYQHPETRRGAEADLVAHKGLARAGAKRQLGPLHSKNGGARRLRPFSSHVNASPGTGKSGQMGKVDHSKEIKDTRPMSELT